MALRRIDSFDHYTTNVAFSKKWTGFNGSPAPGAGGGRFNNGMQATANTFWYLTLDAQPTWIVGMAFRLDSITPSAASSIISLYDGTTLQSDLCIGTDRKLFVTRNGTTLGTGTATLTYNVWYYLEFKCTISDASGVAVVRINGVNDINLSSQDTKNTANATAERIQFYAARLGGAADTLSMDDLYICDGTGSAPANDFLGDCRVEALLPNGNGNSSQFDGSDGNTVDNYLLVDESTPNDDTDYVESPDVGDKDTYAFGDLVTTSGTVYGVQPIPYMRKTNAGVRTAVSVARLSGTEVDSAAKTVFDSYIYLPDVRETKPGGGAWTISDVNSAEFGVKVNS